MIDRIKGIINVECIKEKKYLCKRENYKRQKHKSNALVIPDERRGAIPPCRSNDYETKKTHIKN